MKHLLLPIPLLAAFAFISSKKNPTACVYGSWFGNSGNQTITETMHKNSSFPKGILSGESEIRHFIYSNSKTDLNDAGFPLIDAINLADSLLHFASNEMKEWLVYNGCILKYIPVSENDDDFYGTVVKSAFYKEPNFKQDESDIIELLLLVQLVKDYDAQGKTKIKIAKIMQQILMGDIESALRSYAVLMDKDMRQFTKLITNKLDGVRKARSLVILNFAKTKPPKGYAGKNPGQAARAQDRSRKYIQASKNFLRELNETELVNIKQTIINGHSKLWGLYKNLAILDSNMDIKDIVKKIKESDLGQFDSQIQSMMNNNIMFLSIQTKVQNVSQQVQLMSNIYKADSDAKLNAIRNVRDGNEEDKPDSLTFMRLAEYYKNLLKSPANLGCGLDSLVYFSNQLIESAYRVIKLASELSGFYSFIKLSTQLMNELQNTERELVDALSTQRRNTNKLWEIYKGLKEAESRTTRAIIQGFR